MRTSKVSFLIITYFMLGVGATQAFAEKYPNGHFASSPVPQIQFGVFADSVDATAQTIAELRGVIKNKVGALNAAVKKGDFTGRTARSRRRRLKRLRARIKKALELLQGDINKLRRFRKKIDKDEQDGQLTTKSVMQLQKLPVLVARRTENWNRLNESIGFFLEDIQPKPIDFTGRWRTNLGTYRLTQTAGGTLTGSWTKNGGGTIRGSVIGNVASGRWSTSTTSGSFSITMFKSRKRFSGVCAGQWSGRRGF